MSSDSKNEHIKISINYVTGEDNERESIEHSVSLDKIPDQSIFLTRAATMIETLFEQVRG